MSRRSRPSKEKMRERTQHSYDHRGQSGKFADIFTEDLPMWKPSVGQHELMIVPYLFEGKENSVFRANKDINQPFSDEELDKKDSFDYKLTVFVHNNIGVNEDAFLCLRTVSEACPICEHRMKLEKEDPDLHEKEISSLWPSKRALYNVVVLDTDKDIDEGVKVWDAPHKSIEDPLSEEAKKRDRATGELEHKDYTIPDERWNVCFERIGTSKTSTEYKQVKILERQKHQECNEKEIDAFYEQATCFEDVIEIKTYDELFAIHHGVKPEDMTETTSNRERGRGSRDRGSDPDPSQDEPTTGRGGGGGRGRTDTDNEEKTTSRRGGGRTATTDPENNPECFGIKCNMLDECEKCTEKVFDACLDAFEKAKKEKESGSSDRSSRTGRRGR